jgi:hypothetical protein
MSATNRAVNLKKKTAAEAIAEARSAAPVSVPAAPLGQPARVPQLRVMPLISSTQHRRFLRVPTYAVGVSHEHREYPRASLKLPLRLRSVNQVAENFPITLVTRDISSTGVFFLCPKELAAGTAIEIEIVLVSRPMGRGNVVIATPAHVRRIERAAMPGWYGVAASFDDVNFDRDDCIPMRFLDY